MYFQGGNKPIYFQIYEIQILFLIFQPEIMDHSNYILNILNAFAHFVLCIFELEASWADLILLILQNFNFIQVSNNNEPISD